VKRDDVIAELETDKVILEIPAPHDGVLSNIIVSEGSTVTSAQLLAHLKPQAVIEETVTPVTETLAMPSARLEAQRSGVELADVAGSGRNGRILKEDVQRVTPAPVIQPERVAEIAPAKPLTPGARQERREPMSRLRQRIAERLLASQQNNAILTTFNEVNMQSVMDLRTRWKDRFAEKHGVKLG
ncbi:E3 binding domain-containing protein, partial [Escherichia coli]